MHIFVVFREAIVSGFALLYPTYPEHAAHRTEVVAPDPPDQEEFGQQKREKRDTSLFSRLDQAVWDCQILSPMIFSKWLS